MTLKLALACLLPLALAFAAPARAQSSAPLPVDDSASQVMSASEVAMKWDSLVPGPGKSDRITGQVVILVRLELSSWQGRQGRIYQRLAPQPGSPVTASWTAQGPLLPGSVRDGERTLVYSGPILWPRLEDTFRMTIEADGGRVVRPQNLEFSFEIELEPAA